MSQEIVKTRYQFILAEGETYEAALQILYNQLSLTEPFNIEAGEYNLVQIVPVVLQSMNELTRKIKTVIKLTAVLERVDNSRVVGMMPV